MINTSGRRKGGVGVGWGRLGVGGSREGTPLQSNMTLCPLVNYHTVATVPFFSLLHPSHPPPSTEPKKSSLLEILITRALPWLNNVGIGRHLTSLQVTEHFPVVNYCAESACFSPTLWKHWTSGGQGPDKCVVCIISQEATHKTLNMLCADDNQNISFVVNYSTL